MKQNVSMGLWFNGASHGALTMMYSRNDVLLKRGRAWWLAVGLSALALLVPSAQCAGGPDFNFDVRPILSDRCYLCHGTDVKNNKGGLRLDSLAGATKGGKSGKPAVVPGQPEKSELMVRLIATDPDDQMPPPESHLSVTEAERETLRQWIAHGAVYEGHWAFQPVERPSMPIAAAAGADQDAVAAGIDALVESKLKAADLTLSPPASKGRLLRRLSLDLTGLPPLVSELEAFERDESSQAYDRQVDRLLASPHFGERMAQDWCDVARFADSFGYQSDVEMHAWPWRDYVISSFNKDKPFDNFIIEQLAGDLLPDPTREQLVATAFNRLHRQTNEGGSIEEEFRVEYVNDRVQTYGLAFLGLTLECARCHDHKYDPVTQKDFYQMGAFFQNIDESGLYSHFTDATPTPALSLAASGQQTAQTLAKAAVARFEAQQLLDREARRSAFAAWSFPAQGQKIAGLAAHFPMDELKNKSVVSGLPQGEAAKTADEVTLKPGKLGQAVLLSGENNVNFKEGGDLTRDDAWTYALWMQTPDVKERAVILHRSKAWTDAGSCGYELMIEDGCLSAALIHFWPGDALRVKTKAKLPPGEWTHVVWTYDGSSRASGCKLYLNGKLAPVEVIRDGLTKDINRGGEDRVAIGQRFRDRGFKDGLIDEVRLYRRALTSLEARVLAAGGQELDGAAWAAASVEEQFEHYLATSDEVWTQSETALRAARRAHSKVLNGIPQLMVMKELASPKPAFILNRGAYDDRREQVFANSPSALPQMRGDLPKNRLGLAKWTVSPENPLTSRVLVNRLWQSFFGHGLVRTPEDFGLQGQLPTHPQVLDLLAAEFMASGWKFKALVRHIVLSRTYRQDSACSETARQADPENRLYSRGPSHRLSAEAIRDQALFLSGVLDVTVGGPSVKGDHQRRSLYSFWKRTMPDVRMDIFDMAKREVCVARRQSTNTPLQALTLLNEPSFLAAAARTAQLALKEETGSAEKALSRIFRQASGRLPTPQEATIISKLYLAEFEQFTADPAAAKAFLTSCGLKEMPPAPVILAALTHGAVALLNLDECVMKR